MAEFCHSSAAHMGLAELVSQEEERQRHLRQALEASQGALAIFQEFGFVQVIECSVEEIYYRHSRALSANGNAGARVPGGLIGK
jgi:hypothetical protein